MRQMLTGLLHHSIDGRAAYDETTASAGAFAERKERGVAMAHAHLRGVYAQLISNNLGKPSLRALAMGRDTGIDDDVSRGSNGYLGALDAVVSCGT